MSPFSAAGQRAAEGFTADPRPTVPMVDTDATPTVLARPDGSDADQRRTYPTRVPLVVHALPGERGGVVILMLEDWTSLHGSEGGEP